MKKISEHLGGIIASLAAVALLISSITLFSAPVGGFFNNIISNQTALGNKVLAGMDIPDFGDVEDLSVRMLEGDGQEVNLFAFNEVRFRSSAPVDQLSEVKINGEVVDPDNYIVTEGSTIITFKNDYVQGMDLGASNIEIVSNGGTATGDFTVVKEIPEGGLYVDVDGNEFGPGENFPAEVQSGDSYYYGDYQYRYDYAWCTSCDEWCDDCGDFNHVDGHWALHVIDNSKSEYSSLPLTQINGDYISDWSGAFGYCENLTTAPVIPYGVESVRQCFEYCTSLTTAPVIPDSVKDMLACFSSCTSLTTAPVIPDSVKNMVACFSDCNNLKTYVGSTDSDGDFSGYVIPDSVEDMLACFSSCTSLTTAPVIPDSVKNMDQCFYGCTSLTTAPVIPDSVEDMVGCFSSCTSLRGTIVINANLGGGYSRCFDGTVENIVLTGSCEKLDKLAATASNGNVTVQ